ALLGDVLEQDAGVLRLHFAQPREIGGGYGRGGARRVGGVLLGRRGPLLEVAEDLGGFVVQGDDPAVLRAAPHQPDAAVFFREVAAEALHRGERGLGLLVVTFRAEGVDVAVQAIAAQRGAG